MIEFLINGIYNNILKWPIFDEIDIFKIKIILQILNINHDIAVFGKAISNGFPLGVILGTSKIMQIAQETFISSTFWTEAIGFTTGLTTIN